MRSETVSIRPGAARLPRQGFTTRSRLWAAYGIAFLLTVFVWSWLSRRFVYGEGHSERPILGFLAAYGVAWLIFALATKLAWHSRPPLVWIAGVAIAARVILLPSNLIQENDPYRYVLDGQVTLRGGNPYLRAPGDARALAVGSWALELERPEARVTLSRIGYPEVPTVYPPVAQIFFAAGSGLAGWDWRGQRWVFMAVDALVVGLLLGLPRPGEGRGNLLLYAWNPLVLKEVANSAHLDVLVALFLLLALLVLQSNEPHPTAGRAVLAGGALGLATLSKLYPLVFAPAFCLFLHRRSGWRRGALFLGAMILVCVLGLLPFLGDGWRPLTEGLGVYAREWRMNEGAFTLLGLATSYPRQTSALIVCLVALALPWRDRENSFGSLCKNLQWILLVWFLLIPAAFPWYALPLAALAALRADTVPARVCLVLSGVVGLYYLNFHYEYHGFGEEWWLATRIVEHAAIWGSILWFSLRRLPGTGRIPV